MEYTEDKKIENITTKYQKKIYQLMEELNFEMRKEQIDSIYLGAIFACIVGEGFGVIRSPFLEVEDQWWDNLFFIINDQSKKSAKKLREEISHVLSRD